MQIDHIFIFSKNVGTEADQLIDFGLKEGSNRTHTGQGTTNRKFYFDNFFLEILWVIDENEIQNDITSITKLWERSQFQINGFSPFGLCLENSKSTDLLFGKSEYYYPKYFPEGKSIEFIANLENPQMPWTFRLPFKSAIKENNEPMDHENGIRSLTKVIFEVNTEKFNTDYRPNFDRTPEISFKQSNRTHLVLEFDDLIQQKETTFIDLSLTIKY